MAGTAAQAVAQPYSPWLSISWPIRRDDQKMRQERQERQESPGASAPPGAP